MDEVWISKKDLLALTGISYGQLYRWKREKLIPDSWFEKRSAYTGQETFFPKERMLERIRFIQINKDVHSLEKLASMLSADGDAARYDLNELTAHAQLAETAPRVAALMGRDWLTFPEAMYALLLHNIAREAGLSEGAMAALCVDLPQWLSWAMAQEGADWHEALTQADAQLVLVMQSGCIVPLLKPIDAWLCTGPSAQVIYRASLTDCARDLRALLMDAQNS